MYQIYFQLQDFPACKTQQKAENNFTCFKRHVYTVKY